MVNENGVSDTTISVRLIPETYNAFGNDESAISVTNTRTDGYYEFLGISEGNYNIEAEHKLSQTKLLHTELVVIKNMDIILFMFLKLF